MNILTLLIKKKKREKDTAKTVSADTVTFLFLTPLPIRYSAVGCRLQHFHKKVMF
ncbi:hypothetical protein HY358_00060 [Candidatus Roizmanbacteria bacterium]|nr:hypothetical protein [Candidatus Roizmanbacteria bacterium]